MILDTMIAIINLQRVHSSINSTVGLSLMKIFANFECPGLVSRRIFMIGDSLKSEFLSINSKARCRRPTFFVSSLHKTAVYTVYGVLPMSM